MILSTDARSLIPIKVNETMLAYILLMLLYQLHQILSIVRRNSLYDDSMAAESVDC